MAAAIPLGIATSGDQEEDLVIRTLMMLGGLAACTTPASREPHAAPELPQPVAESADETARPEPAVPVAIVEPLESGSPAVPESGPVIDDDPVAEGVGAVEAPPTAIYALRSGETLDHFARWSGLTVEEIAESSALSVVARHDVGTEIVIAADDDLRATIDASRDAHHADRVERFLSRRGGVVDHATYTVRTGDTAWHVARQNGDVPVWIVEALNPTVDLDDLRPGQRLTLPVTADMVPSDDAVAESDLPAADGGEAPQ